MIEKPIPKPQQLTPKITGVALVVISLVIITVVYVVASLVRPLSGFENVLLQLFSMIFGFLGSYILGRESAREAARDIIKPHARSAFRRLLSVYESLSRIALAIDSSKPAGNEPQPHVLDKLQAMVTDQIYTVDDALEDWRDIVPEDVTEILERFTERTQKQRLTR